MSHLDPEKNKSRNRLKLDFHLPGGLSIGNASSKQDLIEAFSLLHEAYVDKGYMDHHSSGMRLSIHQALPTTSTFVAKLHGEVVATMSSIQDSPFGLPIDGIFDISSLRKSFHRITEISGLAIRSDMRGKKGALLFSLIKYLYHYTAIYNGSDCMVISVNPSQENLYDDILLFKPLNTIIAEKENYVNGAPAIARYLPINGFQKKYRKIYGSLKNENKNLHNFLFGKNSDHHLFPIRPRGLNLAPVMSPEMLKFFLREQSSIFRDLPIIQKVALRNTYLLSHYDSFFQAPEGGLLPKLRDNQRYRTKFICELEGIKPLMTMTDASRNGACLILDKEKHSAIQSFSKLKIMIGNTESIHLKVEPIWNRNGLLGIKIINPPLRWIQFLDMLDSWFLDSCHELEEEVGYSLTKAS